jgi:TIR domain
VVGQAVRILTGVRCWEECGRSLHVAMRNSQCPLDAFELKIGDSLRRKIDDGLVHSRFGVVILSKAFFAKNWPQHELDGLVTRTVSGEQTILPIWHGITKAEVMAASPSLSDKIARSTADFTIEEIAAEIADVVRPIPMTVPEPS